MRLFLTFFCFSSLFLSSYAQVEDDLQQRLMHLASDPALEESLVGICVCSADGRTIVDINAEKMLVPASNMKLISTGAALDVLGEDYRFETHLAYTGVIADGVLKGDLYIVGGADPTLGSKDSISVELERTFSQWEKILRAEGIRTIEGHVVGDGRWLDGELEEPTWLWNDLGAYYGTGVTGLMFYQNMQSFNVSAGEREGDPVNIEPSYPDTPWMEFRYECHTGAKGTGDRLYMYTSEFAPIAAIRGTFGVDRAAKRVDCSNKFPEYTCADAFVKWLRKRGIRCVEGPTDFRLKGFADGGDQLKRIGFTSSPSLERIVFQTNRESNNLYAETLFRALGKKGTGSSCYDSSYVAVSDVLKDMGLDISKGLRIQDGCGLSRQNHVSPDFFCRFLAAMMSRDCYDAFLGSLPIPGGDGSLQYNMKGQPLALRSRIKVKSGSMNGVRCYSGYILPSSGAEEPLIVSIMTNNCTAPNWKVRPLLDRMLIEIASCYE